MLTRPRIDQLFMFRAAYEAELSRSIKKFKALYGFNPFNYEASRKAGRQWVLDQLNTPAVAASEAAFKEADQGLTLEERRALKELVNWDDDCPLETTLSLLLYELEANWPFAKH